MIRISKLTDYGIVLLSYFAGDGATPVKNAKDLAELAGMPAPTVSKILKALSRAALLVSHRGAKGGYSLARDPREITIAQIILAIEGPISLTECSADSRTLCALEGSCPVRSNWMTIHRAVRGALDNLTLADMARPPVPHTEVRAASVVSARAPARDSQPASASKATR